MSNQIKTRLEYLRNEIRNENISYEELIELQSLKDHIEPGDVELLEAAGVPEFDQESSFTPGPWTIDAGFVYDMQGTCIADPFCSDNLDIDEMEANARLIAAAPEMLNALENANSLIAELDQFCKALDNDDLGDQCEEMYAEIRAILNKAKGI